MGEKKKRSCGSELIKILAALGLLVVCGFVGFILLTPPTQHTVTYEIESGSTIDVSYVTDQGGTEQGTYQMTFSKSYSMGRGDFAYIAAQCGNENCEVACRIVVDGEVWRASASTGDYVIATCEGRIGSD